MALKVSLCICTMNRPEELRRCLASLAGSEAPPYEVIVSDDSTDDVTDAVQRVVRDFPVATYLRGPRKGLSANRNHCLRNASGELIAFVDDDVVLHPEFLRRAPEEFDRLVGHHGTDRVIVTGNEIRPDGRYTPSNLSFLGFYTGELATGQSPGAICINSTLFPAALFQEAVFDENIFFGAEERDISLHAVHLGYRIHYCPELTNYHYPSGINRPLYDRVVVISRVYFGLKRYWLYERSPAKFLVFNFYVLANAVGNRLKTFKIREALYTMSAFVRAWSLFRSKMRLLKART